ncbi:putative ribonuclease H-like domain-containing protein, partial [Tanacetum coccineum]
SKAFRVFNTRTRKVEENLHINFLENKPNVARSGPDWLFNIDLLTNSMNYELVTAGNQTNKNAGFKDNVDAIPTQQYILLPLLYDSPQSLKDAVADDAGKKTNKEPANKGEEMKEGYANSTNRDGTVGPFVSTAGQNFTNADDLPTDPLIPDLEDTGIFSGAYDDEDVGAEADLNNLETTMNVSPIPTTRIHKDHPKDQIIGDINSATQTRRMTKISEEHAMTLVDLPKGKRAIGTKWVYRNKKDKRGIVVRNKARLVAQGYTQEEGIDYDEVFAPVARIEAIRLFLAYASFMRFIVYQMDVKSSFLYGTIEEEVYVCQPPSFEDPQFPDKVYKVEKDLYGLHQAPRAWDSPFDLEAFSDSDYAGDSLDRESTTGGCQFLRKRLISWQCKKQNIVANSTTKAEYVAAANCCGHNLMFHSKTEHIEIRHHFIIDSYEKKLIQVIKIHTDHNVADLLTKAFDVSSVLVMIEDVVRIKQKSQENGQNRTNTDTGTKEHAKSRENAIKSGQLKST